MRDNRLNMLELSQFANKHPGLIQELHKALTEGTPAEGGYTVPTVLSNELLRLAFLNADVRGLFKQVRMTTNLHEYSLVASRHSVAWVAENVDATPSSMTFKKVQLEAKKAVCYQEDFSTELEEDSIADMWQEIAVSMSEVMADEFDYQVLEGDGTVFTGLKNFAGIATVPAQGINGDQVHTDKILSAEYELAKRKIRGDTLIVGIREYSLIKQLKDENNNYLFNTINKDQGILGVNLKGDILGYDVVVTDQISIDNVIGGNSDASYMLLVNKKRAGIFGYRRDMTMKRGYVVKGDKNEVNMVARVAFTGYDENAICLIDDLTPSGDPIV